MSGLCGATILLLMPGIVALVKFEPTTPEQTKPTPECSYSDKPIQGGFLIDITSQNVPTGSRYNISINEEGRPAPVERLSISYQTSNQSEEIKHLKPCTEYELRVELVGSDGKTTLCKSSDRKNKTGTINMTKDHIYVTNGQPGHVCYQSDWDISSSLSKPNNPDVQFDIATICFKLTDENFCSDFTVNFTPENCVKSSFSITEYIPVDFIDFSGISQQEPTGLPAEIKPKLPSNCEHLTVDYTCSGNGRDNHSIDITELEPFTDYSCTGLIKQNNVSINKTTPVRFSINCDLTTTITPSHKTNTSIQLRLETTSNNCPERSTLQKLSYKFSDGCRCKSTPTPPEGTWSLTGLTPYTNYTCEVHHTYNSIRVSSETFKWKTEAGTPGNINEPNVGHLENNVIKVTCEKVTFSGPERKYTARLLGVGGSTQTKEKCDFEFKDLSYLTTYTVEVVADNGILKSKPAIKEFRTSYNKKALVGILFFIIITNISAVAALWFDHMKKHKTKFKMQANEEMRFKSTAFYVRMVV